MIDVKTTTTKKHRAELGPEDIAKLDRAIPANAKMTVAGVEVSEDNPLVIEWETETCT